MKPDPGQMDMFGGPAPARATDTSRQAANALGSELSKLRRLALVAICEAADDPKRKGLTADEVSDTLKVSILTGRPRCSELLKFRFIRKSGYTRPSKTSGNDMIVWAPTAEGLAAIGRDWVDP